MYVVLICLILNTLNKWTFHSDIAYHLAGLTEADWCVTNFILVCLDGSDLAWEK